jgi:hypothetical protein
MLLVKIINVDKPAKVCYYLSVIKAEATPLLTLQHSSTGLNDFVSLTRVGCAARVFYFIWEVNCH